MDPILRLGTALVWIAFGLGETCLGVWILTRRWPRVCALVQTLAIASMNTLELLYAQDRLLAPWPMVAANVAFLSLVWFLALRAPNTPEAR